MTRGDKVHIIATGAQAPYGIGETIAVIPAGHRRKIQAELDQWYNKPDVELHRHGMLLVQWRGQTELCVPIIRDYIFMTR